jgi:Domain of unknown function (DUF1876)
MVSKAKRHAKQPIPASAYYAPYPAPVPVAAPVFPGSAYRGAQINVLHDKNASVTNVEFSRHDADQYYPAIYEFKASGSSKREQGDVYDETIGELIASARAFQSLSRQLMSEATRRVNESTKAQWEAQRRAQEKREAAKRPVKRRTRKEWEKMQEERAKLEAKAAAETGVLGGSIERVTR